MIVTTTMLSFFLDGILSKLIIKDSLFLPLFTIVAIAIIYPYFNNNNYRYFKFISIIGLLYDIVYCNTLFYNFFIFLIIGFIVGLINYLLSNNIYTTVLITILIIFFYRSLTFLFAIMIDNNIFSIKYFFESIYRSLILNIFYCVVVYIITELYSNKKNILRSK